MRFILTSVISARSLMTKTACGSLALVLLAGCGSAPPSKPKTDQARITGTVTNGDKSIPDSSEVVFRHKTEGCTIATKVNAQGRYGLSAADPRVGIPVGTYEVSVRPPVVIAPPVKPGTAEYEKMMTGAPQAVSQPATDQIPEKFYKFETSGITCEAKTGDNEINIDLSKF